MTKDEFTCATSPASAVLGLVRCPKIPGCGGACWQLAMEAACNKLFGFAELARKLGWLNRGQSTRHS